MFFISSTPMTIAVTESPGMPKTRAGTHAPASAALFAQLASETPSIEPVPYSSGFFEKRFDTANDTLDGTRAASVEITKTASKVEGVKAGDEITYTIVIRSATGPLSGTVSLSDTIPDGLVYVPGTLTSTAGEVSDAAAPALSWSGILSPTSVVTVTYGVTVDTTEPASITNAAVITLSGYPAVTRTATILVDPNQVYLPLVLRGALIP